MELAKLAGGAVAERFDIELQKVMENIVDPNTDATKARKLQLTLTFKATKNRNIAQIQIDTKTSLAPASGISTAILMDLDNSGNVVGQEFSQGQLFDDDAAADEAEATGKLSYIERKQAGGTK